MAIKSLGPAESNNADIASKGYVDSAISTKLQAADGDGLTNTGDVLAVNTGSGLEISSDAVRIATSAAGTGLTGGGGSALSVSANYRSIAIPFHLTSSQTTGVKNPKFIAPVAMTVVACYATAVLGSGTALRPSKNGGTSDGTILSSIGSGSVQNNSQSVSLAAGDYLAINITTGGTAADISITFWANIT